GDREVDDGVAHEAVLAGFLRHALITEGALGADSAGLALDRAGDAGASFDAVAVLVALGADAAVEDRVGVTVHRLAVGVVLTHAAVRLRLAGAGGGGGGGDEASRHVGGGRQVARGGVIAGGGADAVAGG